MSEKQIGVLILTGWTIEMLIRFGEEKHEISLDKANSGLNIIRQYFPDKEEEVLIMAVNGRRDNLHNTVSKNTKILDYFRISDDIGFNSFAATTIAILLCAVHRKFPDIRVAIEHSLGNGYYCEPGKLALLMEEFLSSIKEEMKKIISENMPIHSKLYPVEQLDKFNKGRFKFVQQLENKKIRVSSLCGQNHWFMSPLAPYTAYVKKFSLDAYEKGFVIRFPNRLYPDIIPPLHKSKRIFEVFRESKQRAQLLNIRFVDHLNSLVRANNFVEAIQIYEALHEKKIASIADAITGRKGLRFVFIAGPSSSGKTSFMKRLGIQLRINGISFKSISLDDYFRDRDKLPYDDKGQQDFEHFDTIDHNLLSKHMNLLLKGEKVKLSRYDFQLGKQVFQDDATQLHKNEILILEGIHGLNPKLVEGIPAENIFRIYISALTSLNYNMYNRISTSDTRLIRRMIRDSKYRGHSVEETLKRWPSVRAGEEKWIFPYQEQADAVFNSALEYEWSVFRPVISAALKNVAIQSPVKSQARRLQNLLELFLPVPTKFIPPTSIIREFLGGSSFIY